MESVLLFGKTLDRSAHVHAIDTQRSGKNVYGYIDYLPPHASDSEFEEKMEKYRNYGTSLLWRLTEIDEVHFFGEQLQDSNAYQLLRAVIERNDIKEVIVN